MPSADTPSSMDWPPNQNNASQQFDWRSSRQLTAPKKLLPADPSLSANDAYQQLSQGFSLVWDGDYHQARQLIDALARRFDRSEKGLAALPFPERFHRYRMRQAQRARLLGQVLIPLDATHHIQLKRAPDAQAPLNNLYGAVSRPYLSSLREIQGILSAWQWRLNGLHIPALDAKLHAHYGVFAPVRGEYLDLVAQAPLPSALKTHPLALDIGTGTGVLAAILAKRGVKRITATELHPAALACAQDNIDRLGYAAQITLATCDLFPDAPSQAGLIVCNPPWLPGKPASAIEAAIYDQDSRMLNGFLQNVSQYLAPQGEAWLIMSDLAEHLKLRAPEALHTLIQEAGLQVIECLATAPQHPKHQDQQDPLYAARSQERCYLWRLGRG